ncbi:MAG: hypothetical protein KatS3mg087_0035 [Patescibacteria group bacterium]|nr:MAG: hypothetical protein KatS3mg087_0035 [Patescibacteria group bacterium]
MHPLQVHTKHSFIQKVIPGIGFSLDPKMLGKGPGTYTVSRDGKIRPTQRYIEKEAQILPSENKNMGTGVQNNLSPQNVSGSATNTAPNSPSNVQPPTGAVNPVPQPSTNTQPPSKQTTATGPASNTATTGVSGISPGTTTSTPGVSGMNTGTSSSTQGVSGVSGGSQVSNTGVSSPSAKSTPSSEGLVGTPPTRELSNPYTYLPQLPDRSTWYSVMGAATESSYRQLQMLYDNHPQLVANSRIPQLMSQIGSEARDLQSVDVSSLNPYELRMYNTRVSRLNGFKQELAREIERLTRTATTYRQLQSKYPALSAQHLSFAAGVLSNKPAIESAQKRAEEIKRLAYDRLLKGEINQDEYNRLVNTWDNNYRQSIARAVGSVYGVSPEEVTPDLVNLAQDILKNPNELPSSFVNSRVLEGYVTQFQPVQPQQPHQSGQQPVQNTNVQPAASGSEPVQSSWSGIDRSITYAQGPSARQYRMQRSQQAAASQQVQYTGPQMQFPAMGGFDLSQVMSNPMAFMMLSGIDPLQMMLMQSVFSNPNLMNQFKSFLENLFSGFGQQGTTEQQASAEQQASENSA